MKKIILSLLVLFSFSLVNAQITDDQYKSLIPLLKTENWKAAFKSSSKLLKKAGDDTSDNACLVRFVNVYAAAGMVKIGKMKYPQLQKITDAMKGKKMLSPDFVASMNPQNTLNKTFFTNFDGQNKGVTTLTTKLGKIILFIEYDFAAKVEPRALHGTMVSCGGVMKDIELNPEKNTDYILTIKVPEAIIK